MYNLIRELINSQHETAYTTAKGFKYKYKAHDNVT